MASGTTIIKYVRFSQVDNILKIIIEILYSYPPVETP
jgi:hypothetical protein